MDILPQKPKLEGKLDVLIWVVVTIILWLVFLCVPTGASLLLYQEFKLTFILGWGLICIPSVLYLGITNVDYGVGGNGKR